MSKQVDFFAHSSVISFILDLVNNKLYPNKAHALLHFQKTLKKITIKKIDIGRTCPNV
jgi:hypothetical protein